jgi:hypothetical protein
MGHGRLSAAIDRDLDGFGQSTATNRTKSDAPSSFDRSRAQTCRPRCGSAADSILG